MKTKKRSLSIIVLLIFSLVITACTATERPAPQDQNKRPEPIENNTNRNESMSDKDATVNDNRTRNNIMPDQPEPVTPTSESGFTLNQINEFDLNIELVNNGKIDMFYNKAPNNRENKVETRIDGKTDKVEHEKASRQVEELLRKIPGASISDTNRIIDGILSALKVKREDVIDFDMEFIFETGEKVHIEFNKEE